MVRDERRWREEEGRYKEGGEEEEGGIRGGRGKEEKGKRKRR